MFDPNTYERKYRLAWVKPGFSFRIESKDNDRIPVTVSIEDQEIQLTTHSESELERVLKENTFNPIQLGRIIQYASDQLMSKWQGKKKVKRNIQGDKFEFTPQKLIMWAKHKTTLAIAKQIKEKWLEMLPNFDQELLAVNRKIFSVYGPNAFNYLSRKQWDILDEYEKKDFFKYRAAVISYCHQLSGVSTQTWCVDNPFGEPTNVKFEKIYWRDFFSNTEKSYTSLNKTLDHIGGGISNLLINLKCMHLRQPIYGRSVLLLNLSSGQLQLRNNEVLPDFAKMLQNSTKDEIKVALQRHARYAHIPKVNTRKSASIINLTSFLSDVPFIPNRKLPNYTDYAIDFHRNNQFEYAIKGLDPNRETVKPPIALPTTKGIRFLSTVKEIGQEGAEMGHCISGYARGAVEGSYYLFGVEYNSERASVQVSLSGRVVQCHGPHNRNNNAVKYAKRVLEKWGKPLRADPNIEKIPEEDFMPF